MIKLGKQNSNKIEPKKENGKLCNFKEHDARRTRTGLKLDLFDHKTDRKLI